MNISIGQQARQSVTVFRHVLAAGRLYFLGGGALVYALGALIARYETGQIRFVPLLLGLVVVLCVQLMTNYLNEYWDRETDALVATRTWFSGGSGVLTSGLLGADVIRLVAIAGAVAAIVFTAVLGLAGYLSWLPLLVIALGLLGGISYSALPVRLVQRGVSEPVASCIVAFLVPLAAYSLQTGGISRLLIATCLPLIMMQLVLYLSIELPDYAADRATGKRNLVVRIGLLPAARLQNAVLLAAYLISVAGVVLGLPLVVALLPLLELPIALLQMALARAVAQGDERNMAWMTFLAIALFTVFAALQVVGYLLA